MSPGMHNLLKFVDQWLLPEWATMECDVGTTGECEWRGRHMDAKAVEAEGGPVWVAWNKTRHAVMEYFKPRRLEKTMEFPVLRKRENNMAPESLTPGYHHDRLHVFPKVSWFWGTGAVSVRTCFLSVLWASIQTFSRGAGGDDRIFNDFLQEFKISRDPVRSSTYTSGFQALKWSTNRAFF